jgi:hypothetical protein
MLVLDSIGLLESKMPRKRVGRFVALINRIDDERLGWNVHRLTNMLVRIERWSYHDEDHPRATRRGEHTRVVGLEDEGESLAHA